MFYRKRISLTMLFIPLLFVSTNLLSHDGFQQQAFLKASNPDELDYFSSGSIAISGDTVVVGAPYEGSNATGVNGDESNNDASISGAVYVFTRDTGIWTKQAYLKASNTDAGDLFGSSVAISGDTLIVGAPWEGSGATGVNGDESNNNLRGSGAVYVFTRNSGVWSQQAYLKASVTDYFDEFGTSVAISSDTLIVGAKREDSDATCVNGDESNNNASSSGAVYVFTRNAEIWSQQAYLKSSNTDTNDKFGASVAISGDTLIVGAPYEESNATGVNGDESNNDAIRSGAAYVFTRSSGVWSQQAYLKAWNSGELDYFGHTVDISENTVVVGAFGESSNSVGVNGDGSNNDSASSGAAYVFNRSAGNWYQQAYLKASNTDAIDMFGTSVSIFKDSIIIGASEEDSSGEGVDAEEDNNDLPGSGAAYVFSRSAGIWSQAAYLKASNTDSSDFFGIDVAISGDLIVVGASGEASNSTGINGSESNNYTDASGAVYVYQFSKGTWQQEAYLKASNPDVDDWFGYSLSISDDHIVVGSVLEDSDATGIDGDDSSNYSLDSGAAYVFSYDDGKWSQKHYLKSEYTQSHYMFGSGVSIDDDNILVAEENEGFITHSSGAAYVFKHPNSDHIFLNGF